MYDLLFWTYYRMGTEIVVEPPSLGVEARTTAVIIIELWFLENHEEGD